MEVAMRHQDTEDEEEESSKQRKAAAAKEEPAAQKAANKPGNDMSSWIQCMKCEKWRCWSTQAPVMKLTVNKVTLDGKQSDWFYHSFSSPSQNYKHACCCCTMIVLLLLRGHCLRRLCAPLVCERS